MPLLVVVALLVFEETIPIPSCKIVPSHDEKATHSKDDDALKVMMVANLLLLGSEAGFINIYFRDSYTSKFFKKSIERLQPDMLIVLGDFSARGSELKKSSWLSVLQQFQNIMGPFLGLPLHVVLGDRDIGECSKLDVESVRWIASNLPGLDSSASGAFEMSNISFVSLNSVAMLCGVNDLRFNIEKVIERESTDLQSDSKSSRKRSHKPAKSFGTLEWRETDMESGSGPVLLLHFPLHRTTTDNCGGNNFLGSTLPSGPNKSLKLLHNRGIAKAGPYELVHTLPPNATEYIFQALKPRIVFSAHSNGFCDHIHEDGTREVTVPAMTWDARNDPGFVVATFGKNKTTSITRCSLAKESHVIMACISVFLVLISTTVVASQSPLMNVQR